MRKIDTLSRSRDANKAQWHTWCRVCLLLLLPACSKPGEPAAKAPAVAATKPPNIIWILWDTVRADHLGTYGYTKPTTPNLDAWAKGARVYDDCIATAPHTIPSVASLFTSLLPTEHGLRNGNKVLDDKYRILPEILQQNGYRTYMYSANPHVSNETNYQRGFDVHEYPWLPKYRKEAFEIVKSKIPPQDNSSELVDKVRASMVGPWNIKSSGELTQRCVLDWLHKSDTSKPYFAYLHYMEAHRPYIPAEKYRRLMNDAQVTRSYQVDRSWVTIWSYVFNLHQFTDEELGIIGCTYDAGVAELDDLFGHLITALEADGQLENTLIVVTADHGELLGEHHMLDHQFALYQPLVHVPLIIKYPPRFAVGRDTSPVSTIDIFPTLLEQANIPMPADIKTTAVSLSSPQADRIRIGEYPAPFEEAFNAVQEVHPDFKPGAWTRTLRSITTGNLRYIAGTDGRTELYNLREDGNEQKNHVANDPDTSKRLAASLDRFIAALTPASLKTDKPETVSDEERERLEALGYIIKKPENKTPTAPQTATTKPSEH